MDAIRFLSHKAHAIAVERGLYKPPFSVGEHLMLMVRSVSHAMGDVRRPRSPLSEIRIDARGKPYGFPIHLANLVISACSLAHQCGVDLGAAIETRMEYNLKRVPKKVT